MSVTIYIMHYKICEGMCERILKPHFNLENIRPHYGRVARVRLHSDLPKNMHWDDLTLCVYF